MTKASRAEDPVLPAAISSEQIQNSIAMRLDELMKSYRDKQMPRMQSLIQDIRRAVKLPENRVKWLSIAAKGAIDQGLSATRTRLQSEADSRTKGLGPGPAANALKNLSNDNYYMPSASRETLWKESLNSILSNQEGEAYKNVVNQRITYRNKAMASLISLRARTILGLGPEPAKKLHGLLEKAIAEYLPDIAAWYGGDDEDIYSGYYYCLALGVPEKEIRPLLTPAQWTKWPACAGDNAGMWPEIKRMHEERLKQEKAKP